MVTRKPSRHELRRRLIKTQIARMARRLHARDGVARQRPESLLGDRFSARPCAIYVARLGESSIAWHLVEADYIGGSRYQIVSRNGIDESHRLEFQVGQTVRCELAQLAEGQRLVAVGRA